MCVSKAWEWPQGWQMPGPRAVQNLQMPPGLTRWANAPQWPRRGGGLGAAGIDCCIMDRYQCFLEPPNNGTLLSTGSCIKPLILKGSNF